jgi:signal transduction histidine kinase
MAQDMTFQHKLKREVNMKQAMLRGAYDELLQQNSQLLALDQAKNRFVALVTHELRTPLSAIIAVVDALINNLCDGEEQKKEFINMIHEQALLLQALVNDVLDFAKIQAGKMEYYIEEQNLEDLVTKQVEHYRNMALESKITINYTPDPKQDFRAYFDNLRMTEIINNILSNAIKYNRIGGDITVNLYSQEHHVDFVVTDTGKGIAKDKVPHVFNEFETVGSLNNHHKGTGLGMPICKRLIEAMGGQIYLQSELGKGTTFTVEVPKEKVVSPEHYRQRTTEDWDIAS